MIMRAEEECLPYGQIHRHLMELLQYCDQMDCESITSVLNSAVSGFGDHQVRYDHVWKKQGKIDKQAAGVRLVGPPALASNVQELFPEKL
jgi:hypothetical protein